MFCLIGCWISTGKQSQTHNGNVHWAMLMAPQAKVPALAVKHTPLSLLLKQAIEEYWLTSKFNGIAEYSSAAKEKKRAIENKCIKWYLNYLNYVLLWDMRTSFSSDFFFCILQLTLRFFWASKLVFVISKGPVQFTMLRLLYRWHLHSLLLKAYNAFWNIKIMDGWNIHWTVKLPFSS